MTGDTRALYSTIYTTEGLITWIFLINRRERKPFNLLKEKWFNSLIGLFHFLK